MKTIVIYKSKSGFVKKYAEWISKSLNADISKLSEVRIENLKDYETIIYGGGLYIGGINGIKFILKNEDYLDGKNIVIFASGATPPRKGDIDTVVSKNFNLYQQKKFKFFYLRGGFDFNKLTFIDKILMTLLKLKLKMKKKLDPDELGMLIAYDKPMDFTKEEKATELIEYVKSIKK